MQTKEKEHALLAPSAAHRWMKCPGSVFMEQGKEEVQSEYAKEGSLVHDMIAAVLRGEQVAIAGDESSEEMVQCVHDYTKFIFRLCEHYLSKNPDIFERFIEYKFRWSKEIWGTVDFLLIANVGGEVTGVLVDYKHGKGVDVEVAGNEQLMTYAAMVEEHFSWTIDKMVLIIYQPRTDKERPIKSTVVSKEELQAWGELLDVQEDKIISALEKGEAIELKAGEHCRFCLAQGECKAFSEYTLEKLGLEKFSDDIKSRIQVLSNEQKVEIFKVKKQIEQFLDAVAKNLAEQLKLGLEVEGVKLVKGRQQRKWKNGDEVATARVAKELKRLGVEPWKKVLIGIGEAEKAVGKNKINHLCDLTEAKENLALEEDSRTGLVVDGELAKLLEE